MNSRYRLKREMASVCQTYGKRMPSVWQAYVLLLLLTVVGTTGAWGQITPTTDTTNPVYYLFQNVQNPAFYMKPNGTKVTTLNSLTDDMKWFFMDAGTGTEGSESVQYYYICRKKEENIQYMYFSGPTFVGTGASQRIWIDLVNSTDGKADKCKFYIAANSGIGGYNIIPKGTNTANKSSLNKQGGNAGVGNLQVGNGLADEASCWNIIAMDAYEWTLHPNCFRVSDNTNKYFYKIKSQNNANYYIKPGTTYVETSNVVNDDMIWYFEEAESDDFMTYYYIRHANTGQYLRYCNFGNNATELADHTGSETGEAENRFQFVVARGTNANETVKDSKGGIVFNIIPKLLKAQSDNRIVSLSCETQGGALKTYNNSTNCRYINHTHWFFESTVFSTDCVQPEITFSNETGKVTISTETTHSQIHYTTDGTTPSASVGTLYEGPFDLTEQTTIKAIVTRAGFTDSEVVTETIYKVATPTIQNNGENAISITSDTEWTTIYYTTDGSTPTTSSTEYTEPLTEDVSGKTIKAIAIKEGWINSDISSGSVTLQCAKPEFIRTDETHLTISCNFPTSGVRIYYTINGSDPTSSSTLYSGAITVAKNDVIKAIAIADGYDNSAVATKKIFNDLTPTDGKYLITSQDDFENFIDMASTEDGSDKHYVLKANVSAGSEILQPFSGIFEADVDPEANGNFYRIRGLSHALFNIIDGGTVRNVILEDVSISGTTNAGAIANEATGASRIYNCGVLSGTVSGSHYVGSIVGLLEDTSRVINCFSFADVSGSGEYDAGGIVGNNGNASTASDISTMVMNCVFYGDITGGSEVSPVYGGENINNLHGGLNTFNYYAYENLKTTAISKYNCALGVEDRFLKRIETYRQLLNSNRRLAAKYASKDGAPVNASDMAKWVLEAADRSIATPKPYPVLKAQAKYPSIVNYDTRDLAVYSEANRNQGLQTGTLEVTISGVGSGAPAGASITNASLTLTRTDKDKDRFNFNYDKVQLPYYNEVGEGNYTGNKVVTGWKITNITGGTAGTYSATDAWGGFNFADRNCTNKDLYGTGGSNRVFSQGAYFDVPYGVTGITIEPYWGQAAYVADEYLDVVYSTGYAGQSVTALGKQFGANGVEVSINGSTQKVYTTINNAVGALSTGGTVYDHAVVLVGNVHLADNPPTANKSFTIMSADLDNDNEPDNSFIFGHNNRQPISPVRFDFINMPGIAMAQKPNGAETFRNVSIFNPKGWFEITNTCLVRLVQLEYDNGGKSLAPVIVQGGLIDQFVSTQRSNPDHNTSYIHLGGNAWFKDFGNGTHSDGANFTPHIPISVTGGEYEGFYLSGTYRPDATVKADNAECYISSGYFGEVAGAAQQQIKGDVRWQIYNADIENFYGGGINFNTPVTGNIQTDIFNSHVGTFCGGPKFGDMSAKKIVTTNATGCTFDTYFGAGYGGISYNRIRTRDKSGADVDLSSWQSDYTGNKGKYFTSNNGVATDFDYEFFVWSTGVVGARFYVKYSSLSMAKTNDVSSTLTNCIINRNFYGGGNLGKVDGKATSVLDGCTVEGNVFGGGYSATTPKVPYRTGGFSSIPKIDKNAGVFDMGKMSATEDYTLIQGTLTNNTSAINTTEKTIVTDVDMTTLGQVTTTDLTIKGSTIVRGKIFNQTGVVTETSGGVFGGGDMSAVHGNTKVDIVDTESTSGILNVFGGGNTADVGGNTQVDMTGGKVVNSVYGGGKGSATTVAGDVLVNLGTRTGEAPSFTYTGEGTVAGNVYGGSALGAVNATKDPSTGDLSYTAGKKTDVNIYKGTVNGSVFGGGLGLDDEDPVKDVVAQNFGPVSVLIDNSTNANAWVKTAVFGGSNENGVLKQSATVTITGGTVGTEGGGDIKNIVFGGGFGQPTVVQGNVAVNIGSSGQVSGGAVYHGNIYGGSALGGVNVTNTSGTPTADTRTEVNLNKGTINGNVFGGGLGKKNGVNGATSDIAATVGGDVYVTLNGAKLNCTYIGEDENRMPVTGQIFGCNNLNGTPKGHVRVWVKKTVDSDKSSEEALAKTRDERTIYDVAAVYGGGNQADYVPTDATSAACAEVIIEGCDETSIQYVYGGGNAAAVPATDVTIKGTYIIDYVFGGGNGKSTDTFTNPGANIGIYDHSSPKNYGSGKAVTKLYAGKVHVVYGGSNTKGNVRGGTSVTMPQKPVDGKTPEYCSALDVREIYGAGQNAEQDGGVTMVLGCVTGLENVYGGAKDAHVKGGVDLVITSGHFTNVFGGNDTSGTIQGPITVTIEETGCEPVEIDNLYLGGNNAAYSVYGYKDVSGTLTARTQAEYETLIAGMTEEQIEALGLPYAAPALNVVSCTSIGNVFGGGYGSSATMYGSPTVNINMIPGEYAEQIDRDGTPGADNNENAVGSIGNIYGGGNAADVIGDTHVNICTEPTVAVRTNMGAEIPVGDRTPVAVKPAYITGNVFGAGKGDADHVDYAKVTGNTTIVMGGGEVKQSVYGGGELSQVTNDTHITITGGTIGTTGEGGETYGNVYGGGRGNDINVRAGLVLGNTNITIEGSSSILHSVYGGGAHGSVGTYVYESEAANAAISDYTTVDGEGKPLTGVANITITGGTIGTDGHDNGMVFGSSRGDIDRPDAIQDNLAWVYDTHVVIGTEGSDTGPVIHGSLYGSGENGHTYNNAAVTMNSGTVGNPAEYYENRGNVYGGGCGTDMYYADPDDETHDGHGTLFNPKAGIVRGDATVIINGGSVANNIYGAGSMGKVERSTSVTINTDGTIGVDGTHDDGNVYGAARGELGLSNDYASVTSTSVTLTKGTVKGSIYGGGRAGVVNGAVAVSMSGGTVMHDVYGGGALANTNTEAISEGVYPATTVTLSGATVTGIIYGGGLGQKAADAVGEPEDPGYVPAVDAVAANVYGAVTVTVSSGQASNVFGCNNLNGAPQGAVVVNINGGTITNSVFGGGNQAAYGGSPTVNITGGTINYNVFGGGNQADVAGSVNVIISGGEVKHDVYGGGALSNTNTANWDEGNLETEYEKITATLTTGVSVVTGLYKKDDANYTLISTPNSKAEAGAEYYRRFDTAWADGKTSASNTTNVILTGGKIGNVYGGGLGDAETPVYVYGDVTINVNKTADIATHGGTGATFTRELALNVTVGGKNYASIPITGSIFGANNFNGSPKGNVTVEIFKTKRVDGGAHVLGDYELQAVYGGGNLANYLPAKDKETKVIIHGCDETSIEKVYGGGNSASVPSTEVIINGAFDIGYAFGGGNGSMPVKNSVGTWVANDGAMVTGDAKISAKGGRIGQVFGGSDAKGDILGSSTTDTSGTGGECGLTLTRLFGAGNEADVAGDVNMILSGCGTSDAIQFVHGGSYNAHIAGDVNLTITSGYYTNVFGGNDARGSIGGHITVNIEETDACKPIVIQNLMGGGNEAPYPGTKKDGTEYPDNHSSSITVNIKSATRIDNIYGGGLKADVKGDVIVNVNMLKGSMVNNILSLPSSYTGTVPNVYEDDGNTKINDAIGTIGNVYGGGNEGNVIGNTIVNIGTAAKVGILKRKSPGGAFVNAKGDSVYNYKGDLLFDMVDETKVYRTVTYEDKDVLGANITGDVFGGGNLAYVTGNTTVNISTVDLSAKEDVLIGGGSIYGGGNRGDVHGNTNVTMSGGYVFNGIFGGGLSGSVGTFTRSVLAEDIPSEYNHPSHAGCIGKPINCESGTGKCTVVVDGGQIGPVEVATQGMTRPSAEGGPVSEGWVWGGGRGLVVDPATDPDMHFNAYVNETDVTIGGTAFVLESIIGGGEFGRVLGNTLVKIQGGQIGVGAGQTETVNGVLKPKRYNDEQFIDPTATDITSSNELAACSHFTFASPYLPYDPYYDKYPATHPSSGSTSNPSDGKTWIGCVFGGGSGYMPYEKADASGYDWCRSAGLVEGNTEVRISGGHILSNVYGANEYTDVKGKSKVTMTDGTIGVPRTLAKIAEAPTLCYLFGAGKGDPRSYFNAFTNTGSVEINVSGGIIYGSVFGGSEDGHVSGNTSVTIQGSAVVGTWGTSYVDGNVFGGGRGFSGEVLGAGNVGGNITVNIEGGKMLGSVYGGGRLASVGIDFTKAQDPSTGQFIEDKAEYTAVLKGTILTKGDTYYTSSGGAGEFVSDGTEVADGTNYFIIESHGHVAINISGGTIGNDRETATVAANGHTMGGNVFGGSMGRLELLDQTTPNPLWTRLAQVKSSTINIEGGAVIKSNVYGGAEYGTIRDNVNITIGSSGTPTVNGHVYGGGYGSTKDDSKYNGIINAGSGVTAQTYLFTPMQYAGCVGGNTVVNVVGGKVKRNVYGGGEMASVGVIDYSVREDATGDITFDAKKYSYINVHKHDDIADKGTLTERVHGFGLSWPYEFSYLLGGKTTVNVTGGRIGTAWNDGTGYIFGGGKGKAFERYKEAHLANVRETEVNIGYASTVSTADTANASTANCILGAVYGGGEDGHVYDDAVVNITGGLIGLSVYGGGKGEGTYKGKLRTRTGSYDWKATDDDLPSWTAGKVYGKTSVTMTGGHVMNNVYGGGNLASVGKGNYASGLDDYFPSGYGETLNDGNLWTSESGYNPSLPISVSNKPRTMADYFLGSGKCTVTITAGEVGTENGTYGNVGGVSSLPTPTGMVFGGSRGRAAEDVGNLSPRYDFSPDFFLGYANSTEVTIGNNTTGPTIYSQVFGGGRDGHVRNSTHVIINKGTIGQAYSTYESLSTEEEKAYHRRNRGNVYGSGSGMGTWDGTHHGQSSGSVTRNTTVDVNGGTIYGNVYGGGAMASVGPPKINQTDFAGKDHSKCTVNINGGTIGNGTVFDDYGYGGCVYGASRGGDNAEGESLDDYATTIWNDVNITGGSIAGNVYGGGEVGRVKKDNVVSLTGGTIAHDAYGGGKGTTNVAADVGGNVLLELNNNNSGETAIGTVKGCIVNRLYGCNDFNGTPKGHVTVHVYATQNISKSQINSKFGRRPALGEKDHRDETIVEYLKRLLDAAAADGVSARITAAAVTAAQSVYEDVDDKSPLSSSDSTAINTSITNLQEELCKLYDVDIVYGGGNLAAYEPTDAYSTDKTKKDNARTTVIIDGCSLTSIRQVYGSGNAASTPATYLRVNGCYEIDEVFGGGNGKDDYNIGTTYYKNPGANVGYGNFMHYVKSGETGYTLATHGAGSEENPYKAIINSNATNKDLRQANYMYGSGIATTEVVGGRIHNVYGGSNQLGNISTMALSAYQESGTCELVYDVAYNAGKNAEIDGEARITLDCVKEGGIVYGGATNADMNSNVTLNITNGSFTKIFGGNNLGGRLNGSITINIQENGCKPIHIDNLYGGGNEAAYSIYGYYNAGTKETPNYKPRTKERFQEDSLAVIAKVVYPEGANETTKAQVRKDSLIAAGLFGLPYASPRINVISATEIGTIYGGGYLADVVGSPSINVNMENGKILAKYMNETDFSVGEHTVDGRTYYVERLGEAVTLEGGGTKNTGILRIGTIGTIFGGGDQANILGNTYVDIGTGKGYNLDGTVNDALTRNAAFITGSVYGGGKKGHVGNFTLTDGKPTSCAEGTGTCYVTISNGDIGPDNMKMEKYDADDKPLAPDDAGHVFGAGQGYLADPDVDATVNYCAYADYTEVVINGTAFVKGSVYGGSENGHVLHDTHVTIDGNCQIGNGDGVNRRYTTEEWAYDVTTNPSQYLAECAHWPYKAPYAPHDMYAEDEDEREGELTASDGHTFYGNVFGGGSGYYPYAPAKWLKKAGWVEGNTLVEIKGGHILTNAYGGNEMTNVGTGLSGAGGKCTVRMSGGTLGVPRTLEQIAAHPVTCYLFGAGKGDQNIHFNKDTNVKEVEVEITGGKIYGSVFGGGEDGHVLGDVKMTIGNDDGTGPIIGTWGTSYVDGNVFGGGRGYSGEALTAGNVGGSIDLDIKGGTMLGSIYGGGRLGSVGYGLYNVGETGKYGVMQDDGYGDYYVEDEAYKRDEVSEFKRGYVDINISGGTIGNEHEFITPIATNIEAAGIAETDFKEWEAGDWTTWKTYHHVPNTEYDTSNGRVLHTKGGNVFAGGMGRRTALNESVLDNWQKLGNVKSTKLTISGDNTWIMGNVYGGGEYGAVTGSHDTKNTEDDDIKAGTEIIINGGTIGTQITTSGPEKEVDLPGTYPTSGNSGVQYTFGSVYGGGYGTEAEIEDITANAQVDKLGAMVADSTYINMTTGLVRASVFGGGEVAAVGGSTNVNISGGEIGRDEVYVKSSDNPGYVKFGSSTMGNVFGGGKGTDSHTLVGVVKGNATINITPGVVEGEPKIYHNVYGGGSFGSVGTFDFSDGETDFMAYIPQGIPLNWTEGTGIATVNIKGGTIGISGRDNGMVSGSSRGDVAKPVPTYQLSEPGLLKDPYDKMAWVEKSVVNIGATGTSGPHIKGSIYGGGENGHVFTHATVNVKSGIIGIVDSEDTWYDFDDEEINKKSIVTRGNVYGSGCGTDTYTGDDGKQYHNPWAGCVIGNTEVNISGGHVSQNVYGGGSMGSVGRIKNDPALAAEQHRDSTISFALSWPAKLVYDNLSGGLPVGETVVNITGGRIGTTGSGNGDVFGGTRGEAGPRYDIAPFGNVRTTEVNINYSLGTPTDANLFIYERKLDEDSEFSIMLNDSQEGITGSVYGGGENGHVYEDAAVNITNGYVGHAVYGGGKGEGTYMVGAKEYPSLTSGKVYGNTSVTMTGGHVMQNVYGGGNLGSVGKGNYAVGADDYYYDSEDAEFAGYGEKIEGNLWDNVSDNSKAFLGSGNTTVEVTGGTIGFMPTSSTPVKLLHADNVTFTESTYGAVLANAAKKDALINVLTKDGLPTGNVFGGCRGQAAAEITRQEDLKFMENPYFFLGYVNETDVIIGDGSGGPVIYGSIYGGGQDGHVRRSTNVTVNKGEIGMPYTTDNQTIFGTLGKPLTEELDNTNWLHRGNVYGGGSGIGMYDTGVIDDGKHVMANSSSAGSVTHCTTVTVNSGINGLPGGAIHRNVYGGGSQSSVGPPTIRLANGPYPDNTGGLGRKFVNTVKISGTIGTPDDYIPGFKYHEFYGGEVYGACRGIKGLEPAYVDYFGTSVWTKVFINNGAHILNNVFGGGDAGKVRKDSEVIIGAE